VYKQLCAWIEGRRAKTLGNANGACSEQSFVLSLAITPAGRLYNKADVCPHAEKAVTVTYAFVHILTDPLRTIGLALVAVIVLLILASCVSFVWGRRS
jgi:hypothetical protein